MCANDGHLRELQQRAVEARLDARLNAVDNPSHRPPWKGECRDYLAQKAKEIITEWYCVPLAGADLRSAVAAVLDEAGATHVDPKKDGAKFDKMYIKPARLTADELEARARATGEKIGGVPI